VTTFEVEIALDDPSVAGGLDEAPVDVRVVSDTAEDVLAVPVTALLALAEGGYAVEVVDADGSTRLVGVEPGFFAEGLVEVTGDVAEGDLVVVP
jgi:multidrug efflux pump subunit AcrA (membrane-fusion protein)